MRRSSVRFDADRLAEVEREAIHHEIDVPASGREYVKQETLLPECESHGKFGRHERFRVGDRMVPADMCKLQAVHKLTVKSHRINLEVEFIVERLAPEARPAAMRVHDCRPRRG